MTTSKTLVKGVELLRLFAGAPAPLTLAQVADRTDRPKATLMRVLGTLVDQELLELRNDGYQLGVACLTLGQAYLDRLDVRRVAAPHLVALSRRVNDTVHLGVRHGLVVVYIDKVEGESSVRMHSSIGATNPLACTGVGKAILAFAGDALLSQVLDAGVVRRTPNTLVTAAGLSKDLRDTRRRGFAVDHEENELGIRCVAAPVFDHTGEVAAAVSTSSPTFRFPKNEIVRRGRAVQETAGAVSRQLGFRGPAQPS